jgi:hypothetical protein
MTCIQFRLLEQVIELAEANYKKTGRLLAYILKPNIRLILKTNLAMEDTLLKTLPNINIHVILHLSIYSLLKSVI